jgi:hypothetical protein
MADGGKLLCGVPTISTIATTEELINYTAISVGSVGLLVLLNAITKFDLGTKTRVEEG